MTQCGQLLEMMLPAESQLQRALYLLLPPKEVELMKKGTHLNMRETLHEIIEKENGSQTGETKTENEISISRENKIVRVHLLPAVHHIICSTTVLDRNIIHYLAKHWKEDLTR